MHMHGKLLLPAAAKHPDMAVALFPALASQIPGSLVLVPIVNLVWGHAWYTQAIQVLG